MKSLMQHVIIICISFTFSTILYLCLSLSAIFPPFDEQMLLNMLFISIGITLFMIITHSLPIQNLFVIRLLEITVIILVLLTAGKIFDLFPVNRYYTSFVLAIGLVTYVLVLLIAFVGDIMSANEINTTIRNKKREQFYE